MHCWEGTCQEARHPHETLLERVWSGRSNGGTKFVRTFVKQPRGKLGDATAERAWIFNVRGVGYDREAWTAMAATFMHAEDANPDDGARH